MKPDRNLPFNRWLAAGLGLNAAYLTVTRLADLPARSAPALFLLGLMEGSVILLMALGLLRAAPRGRGLLDRARRFKRTLRGRGA